MKNNRQKGKYDDLDKDKLIDRLSKAEKQLQVKNKEAERLKTSFLSNISHEIRTPMNAIIGFSDLLKDENLSHEERVLFADNISSSTQQLLSIIENIIEAARIETNQIAPANEICAINDLLEDIYKSYLKDTKYKNKYPVTLKLNFNSDCNPFLVTDPKILRKVLTNIIDNALKFTEEGSIEFGYNIINQSQIQFFVIDSGIGISKAAYKIIFEKFRQIDDKFSKKHSGLGMGLTISRKLIQLLGGKMDIVSSPGIGTKVYLSLPISTVSSQKPNVHIKNHPLNHPQWLNQIIGTTKSKDVIKDTVNWQLFADRQNFSA